MIIAVEGADKAGKHTQVMKIVDYLNNRGIATETLDFPQYNSYWGQFIKRYLKGDFGAIRDLPAEYTMLPYALDRQAHMPQIKQWVDMGKWVVLDRYTYSNVFSIAKMQSSMMWMPLVAELETMEFEQMGIRRPDHNIYLYLPAQVSYAMRNQGLKSYQNGKPDIHESDLQLLNNVSIAYKMLASRDPKNWTVVNEMKADGTRMNPDEVFASVRPVIDKMIMHSKQK